MYEARVYKRLSGGSNVFIINCLAGIPELLYFGIEGDYNVLVIELLGPNLEELFTFCGSKLKLMTTLIIAEQTVKPSTFLML